MKIDVLTPSISRSSGGVGAAIVDLYNNFCELYPDFYVDLLSLISIGDSLQVNSLLSNLSHRSYQRSMPSKLGLSPRLIKHSFGSNSDLIHSHGIWMATTLYGNFSHRFKNKPFIVSPHGMLDPWILDRGRLKKSLLKMVYENYSWRNASVFHALNSAEADAIKRQCPNANIVVIPNGITIPAKNSLEKKSNAELRILFLGRFHTKKNLHNLISAVNSIPHSVYNKSPFKLVIAGWGDETYKQNISEMVAQGYCQRFELLGPVFGEEKDRLFKGTDAFILPSFSEGLPVAVLEAWSYGIPVLMSKHCNLNDALDQAIAIDTGTDTASIARSILEFAKLSFSDRVSLSDKSYAYVAARYNWNKVCSEFYQLYKDVART